jgi:hypothetical protein
MSENPYESPQSTLAPWLAKKRKRVSLLDIVVLIGIVAVLVALLYPSTSSAPSQFVWTNEVLSWAQIAYRDDVIRRTLPVPSLLPLRSLR